MTRNAYDIDADLRCWHDVALEGHARATRRPNVYIRLQDPVEGVAHRLVSRHSRAGSRILEIGIGGGEHLVHEGDLEGRLYLGIDVDRDFARLCRRQFGVPVAVGDGGRLPFSDASFDTVIAMGVLEHLDCLEGSLREVERVLSPGGRLLAVVPTNGGVAIALFRTLVTYPFLRFRGIRRPGLVWHALNASCFPRIEALLRRRFVLRESVSVPLRALPWWVSPLRLFVCERTGASAGATAP